MEEIWKDIKGWEGFYQVSNIGHVKSINRTIIYNNGGVRFYIGKIIKSRVKRHGYMVVCLCKNVKEIEIYVHRLVAEAFISNDENKKQINHKDGNKKNNSVSNLEWVTASENNLHAKKTGLNPIARGANVNGSKLNDETVIIIRELYKTGIKLTRLSERFNVSKGNMHAIINGKIWTHIL